MNRSLPLLAATAAATLLSPIASAAVVSPYFGWDQGQAASAGLNPAQAFANASGTTNIPTDGTANVFTVTFTEGANSGTATFEVTDAGIGNSDLRQFANSLGGPGETSDSVTVTLTGVSNLDSLSLLSTAITSDGDNNYTATLPVGTTSTDPTASSLWSTGQSLVVSHTGGSTDSFNVSGFSVDGAVVVPEPASFALLGLGGLALLARRR